MLDTRVVRGRTRPAKFIISGPGQPGCHNPASVAVLGTLKFEIYMSYILVIERK